MNNNNFKLFKLTVAELRHRCPNYVVDGDLIVSQCPYSVTGFVWGVLIQSPKEGPLM